jgi:hypothetical protein
MNASTDRLLHVFRWPVAHPIRLLLPGMVLVSLLIHVLAAFVVQTGIPSRPALPPWPSKLTILPASGGQGLVLLEARDPSWLEPGRYRNRMLPQPKSERHEVALRPPLPALLPAPRETSAEAWVPSLPPLAIRPLSVQRAPQLAPPALAPAGARFESGAAWVTDEVLEQLRAVAPPEPPGRATELLVVLAPSGDVRHVWLVRGCGDPGLDFAAQRAVQRSRFLPADGPRRDVLRVTWGPRGPAL